MKVGDFRHWQVGSHQKGVPAHSAKARRICDAAPQNDQIHCLDRAKNIRAFPGLTTMNATFARIPPKRLDHFEKYSLCAIFGFFAWRMISGYMETGSSAQLIYLFDQFIIILFLVVRRATDNISLRLNDWLIGYAGTFTALLQGPTSGSPVFASTVILCLMVVGMIIHVTAKLTLRRSFGVVAANRGIKVNGAYQIVRHPMYLGYIISQTGFVLSGPTAWNMVVYLATVALLILRIEAEEQFLKRDAAYAGAAGSKLVPGIY